VVTHHIYIDLLFHNPYEITNNSNCNNSTASCPPHLVAGHEDARQIGAAASGRDGWESE